MPKIHYSSYGFADVEFQGVQLTPVHSTLQYSLVLGEIPPPAPIQETTAESSKNLCKWKVSLFYTKSGVYRVKRKGDCGDLVLLTHLSDREL